MQYYRLWHLTGVCPSVCLSVCTLYTLCIVALRVGVDSSKLYRRVPSRQLPVNFFRHFCCRMYRLAIKRSEKRTSRRDYFTVWNTAISESKTHTAQCATSGTVRTESTFGKERYIQTVSSTIGLPSDSYFLVVIT